MITAFHHSSLSFAVLSNLVYFDPALPRSPAESQTSTSNVRTSAMFFSSAIHFPIPPLVHPLHPSISQHLKQPQNSINLPFTMSTVDRVEQHLDSTIRNPHHRHTSRGANAALSIRQLGCSRTSGHDVYFSVADALEVLFTC